MRVCPSCGHENDDDARFCSACGASLAAPGTGEQRRTMLRDAEAAIGYGEATGDHEVLARGWELAAHSYMWDGRMEEYARALERAVPHARRAGDLRLEARLALAEALHAARDPGASGGGLT